MGLDINLYDICTYIYIYPKYDMFSTLFDTSEFYILSVLINIIVITKEKQQSQDED